MDDSRFDALVRSLTRSRSRRRALVALSGGLGLRGLTPPEDAGAAKSGKCKPKCGECEKCKKGDCDKKDGKKVCKKGKCKPKAAGTPCTAFARGACQNGTCVNLAADATNCGSVGTACGPSQVCQAGSCFPRSTCPATTQLCPGIACGTPECKCGLSTEGNIVCVSANFLCSAIPPCTTSASCAAGEACVEVGACCPEGPTHTCLPRCTAPTAA